MFSRSHSEENLCIKYESLSSPERISTIGSPPRTKEENKDGVSGMDGKRYALRWRHHQSTVVAEVGSLYRDAALVDVTLACEDQRTYQAHKLVLSACSQYFQSLFSRHPAHQHPIIFLKDVSGDECEALLTYMYRGEVSVNQDQIPRILRVASSLQVRGLAEVETQNSRPSSPTFGDRGTHYGSSSPSPSTCPPTKCATPTSEPQSPSGPRPITPQGHLLGHISDSGSGRHQPSFGGGGLPQHPTSCLPQDFPPYHLMPHQRPPHFDTNPMLGPLIDQDRKRIDDKPHPQSLVNPYSRSLHGKPDLTAGNWEGSPPVDVGGLSPLPLPDAPRAPFLPHPLFSLLGQDTHVPTVSQGQRRLFSIIEPLRRFDRSPTVGGETRIHKCQFCARKFKRKDHLKTHIRIHTGERPYKCKVCGRGFIQSQQVKIHMKVHTREDAGALGAASMLARSGTPDTRSALAALYPDLSSGYGADTHSNDRGSRSQGPNPDGEVLSPPQGSLHPDSDAEFSSEAAEKGDYETLPKELPPLCLPPSSSSSAFPLPISSSNPPLSPHATNHSGGRGSPHSAEGNLAPDETCGVSALKGGPSSYRLAANLKK